MTLASNLPSPNRRKGGLLCGAKTRAGGCCQVRSEPGKARCRFHGGKSTGPKTQAGRARIAAAQRLRWRTYRARGRMVNGSGLNYSECVILNCGGREPRWPDLISWSSLDEIGRPRNDTSRRHW
jgi:hypothetical protein